MCKFSLENVIRSQYNCCTLLGATVLYEMQTAFQVTFQQKTVRHKQHMKISCY